MEKFNAKTGKHLIQILMFSMYNDQRIIYREYIQNAYDAISKAVRENVLSQRKDGIVNIRIDSQKQSIVIHDNGIGIPASEVPGKLLNIADSQKDGVITAGQYGIGRLAGAGYCRWLKFKTSSQGEKTASIITFDVAQANKIISDVEDRSSATEVIDLITKMDVVEEAASAHYFEVMLEGVNSEYRDLLDAEAISEYLEDIAPVDYKQPFKEALIQKSLEQSEDPLYYKDLYSCIGHVQVFVNDNEIRKRYGLTIEGTGDDIDYLEFFKVDGINDALLAWGWYAVTPFTKQIPVRDLSRGIRLRKHNIQLGTSDLLNKYFGEARGNGYFYGEIFTIHTNLRPNSDRSGLAPTPETEVLFEKLRGIFTGLGKLYHVANDAKNAVKKVTIAEDKLALGIETDTQKNQIDKKEAESDLLRIEKSSNAQTRAAKRVIELHKYKVGERKKDLMQNTRGNGVAVEKTTDLQHQQMVQKADIYAPLREKYAENEILLIRRVFSYMTLACPVNNKPLLEQLMSHAIKQLLVS
ncbi:MAG: ATP-binding protein [Bacteroides sp.]|nr:ATP-binding protein [Bacteroides sp.]